MIYAIDSNIISYFLKKDEVIRNKVIAETKNNNQFVIPPVDDADLLIAAFCVARP